MRRGIRKQRKKQRTHAPGAARQSSDSASRKVTEIYDALAEELFQSVKTKLRHYHYASYLAFAVMPEYTAISL